MKLIPKFFIIASTVISNLWLLANPAKAAYETAYVWNDKSIHAYTSIGFVSTNLNLDSSLKLANYIRYNKNLTFGVGIDFGKQFHAYNSSVGNTLDLENPWLIGGEFVFQQVHLREDSQGQIIISNDNKTSSNTNSSMNSSNDNTNTGSNNSSSSSNTSNSTTSKDGNTTKSKTLSNSFYLGAMYRYYFNHAIFVKTALGVNATFSTEETSKLIEGGIISSKNKYKHIRPYINLSLGYDAANYTTSFGFTYLIPTGNKQGFWSYTLNIGVNTS